MRHKMQQKEQLRNWADKLDTMNEINDAKKEQKMKKEQEKIKAKYDADQERIKELNNKKGKEAMKIKKQEQALQKALEKCEERVRKGQLLGKAELEERARIAQEYSNKAQEVCESRQEVEFHGNIDKLGKTFKRI